MTPRNDRSGLNRRQAMQLGVGAWVGAGMVDVLRMQSHAAYSHSARAKSCITIWLDGGPSHFETFDPKPDAPMEIRGELNPISTKVAGVQFCQTLPKLAEISDKFAVLRSIRHDQGNHGAGNHYMTTGAPTRIPVGCGAFVSFHPSVGSVVAHELAKPNGLPAYFSIPSMNRSGGPNFLGAKFAPFIVSDDPNGANFRVRDVALPNGLVTDRFNRRTELRTAVDRLKRIDDPAAVDPAFAVDADYHKGLDLVTSVSARKAFDMKSEPDALRDDYGRNSFGQRMLLARRLVEAGVPFITMNHGGWDHHSGVFTTLPNAAAIVDQAVAALIRDLDDRGLLDSTLIVMLGEFGRTPKISTLPGSTTAGRDHWSNAMSVLMAGAGTPGGLCLGATDRHGYSAVDNVKSPENFVSTIYRKLGIDPDKILYTPQGRPSHIVSDATPIIEVM